MGSAERDGVATLPEVILWHKPGDDERREDGCERATCATCGWRGKWRAARSGWPYRDHYRHREDAHEAAMDLVWDGKARPSLAGGK